jgi:hypothetical protein
MEQWLAQARAEKWEIERVQVLEKKLAREQARQLAAHCMRRQKRTLEQELMGAWDRLQARKWKSGRKWTPEQEATWAQALLHMLTLEQEIKQQSVQPWLQWLRQHSSATWENAIRLPLRIGEIFGARPYLIYR